MSRVTALCVLVLFCFAGCRVETVSRDSNVSENSTKITTARPQKAQRSNQQTVKPTRARSEKATTASASVDSQNSVWVTGKVKDRLGAGVEGAILTLWTSTIDDESSLTWRRVAVSQSDANGNYSIQGRAKDATAVTARKEGLAIAAVADLKKPQDLVGKTANQIDLQLLPGSAVSGRIISPDGTGIGNAEILACPEALDDAAIGEYIIRTDSAGNFTIANVPEGKLPIAVAAPGRPVQFFETAAPATDLELKLADKISRLDGRLISDDTDLSKTSATIALEMYSVVKGLNINRKISTGAAASFDFGAVPSLAVNLFVQASPRGSLVPVGGNYNNGRPYYGLSLADGASTTAVIKVTTGETLRGTAIDVVTSRPVTKVRLYPDRESMETRDNFVESASDGSFALPHVNRLASIHVRSDEYYLHSPKVEELLNRDPGDSMTLLMARKPWVRGRVHGEYNNLVPDAKLSLYNLSPISPVPATIPLDSTGAFQVALMPGKYRFFAEAPNCAPTFVDKELAHVDLNDLNLQVDKGRQVSGIVVSPEGNPVAGAVVLSQLCSQSSYGMFEPYYPYGNTTFLIPFGKVITDAFGTFSFNKAPRDAGVAVIARSNQYADTPVYFTDATEGDVHDAQLVFPVTGSLTGTVVDDAGKPVAGAKCEALNTRTFGMGSMSATTSTSGTFEIAKVDVAASLLLSINAEKHHKHQQPVSSKDSPLSITLQRVREKVLWVKCIDVETEKTVAAKVTAINTSDHDQKPAITEDSNHPGLYLVAPVIADAEYIISASADKYVHNFKLQSVIGLPDELWEIPLRRSGRVTGRVVDENGKPVTEAHIMQRLSSTKENPVDENGRFDFELKENQSSFFALAANGNRSKEFYPATGAGGSTDVGDIVVQGNRDILIRVLKGADNKPAPGVAVEVEYGEKTSGRTDQRGEFPYSVRPSSSFTIKLPEWKLTRHFSTREIAADDSYSIVLHIGGGVFQGRLLLDGQPTAGTITGFNESVSNENVSGVALNDGQFKIENLAPGNWIFKGSIASDRHRLGSVTVAIDKNETVEKDIEINGGNITGTVVDESGLPVPDATVEYTSSNGNGGSNTDSDGKFSMPLSGPGKFTFSAELLPGLRSDAIEVMIDGSSQPSIKLVLKSARGRIICTALSILDGLPIQRSSAMIKSTDGSTEISSIANGSINEAIIEDVTAGSYLLTVSAAGYSQAQHNIVIEDGQTLEFSDVLSPAGNVTVQVTDNNGYFVPQAQVIVTPLDSSSLEPGRSGVTSARGDVKFPGLLSGDYQVQATGASGKASATISTLHQRVDVLVPMVLKP